MHMNRETERMFGSSSIIGKRSSQQDAVTCGYLLAPNCHFFGVFDGHGEHSGDKCANYVSKRLPEIISTHLQFEDKQAAELSQEQLQFIVKVSFQQVDDELKHHSRGSIIGGILPHFLSQHVSSLFGWFTQSPSYQASGSCATVLITTPKFLLIANLGDSRIISCHNGQAITRDHNSESLAEIKRIYLAGGYVSKGRVMGNLIPTRAFGDFELKKQQKDGIFAVSIEPEIVCIPQGEHDHIILVCDGVTDVINSRGIANLVEMNRKIASLDEISRIVTRTAYQMGSKDNLSCIVVNTKISQMSSSIDKVEVVIPLSSKDRLSFVHWSLSKIFQWLN